VTQPEEKGMADDSWFKVGDEGLKEAEAIEREREEEAKNRYYDFWLLVKESAKVTFLDSDPFVFKMHSLKRSGRLVHYTCRRDMGECPLCDSGDRFSVISALSLIDHRKFIGKKEPNVGKVYQHQKRPILMKKGSFNKLFDKRAKKCNGDLTWCVFEVTRHAKMECATGEDWDFTGVRRTKEQLAKWAKSTVPKDRETKKPIMSLKEWVAPVKYREILAPKDVDFLRKLVGQAPIGADSSFGEDLDAAEDAFMSEEVDDIAGGDSVGAGEGIDDPKRPEPLEDDEMLDELEDM